MSDADSADIQPLGKRVKRLVPGLSIAFIVALAANFLGEHYGAPTMLFALLLGLALNFLADDAKIRSGVDFAASVILKTGVALLGLRIAFGDIVGMGWQPLAMVIAATGTTIGVGILLSRFIGRDKQFGILTGGAVAICGASAAMALSAILPSSDTKERDTAFTVVGVTTLSTIAMVAYPLITAYLNLDDWSAGLFIGATIHDVAQVVGAGFSISDEAGQIATITKLVRVAMLVPVVLLLALAFRAPVSVDGTAAKRPPILPLFLIMFVIFVGVNSLDVLHESIISGMSDLSRFCLTTAIAAVGIKTKPGDIMQVGWRPALLMVMETIWIAGLVLMMLMML